MFGKKVRYRHFGILIVILAGLVAAVGYGVAQSTVVTQAEWAVYMVQALELDWHLPPNPKSHDYMSRLSWTSGIEFGASQMLPGSSSSIRVASTGAYVQAEAPMAEALYNVGTIRPGNYDFRVKLAGGSAVVKIGDSVFEAFQPEEEFRWVDLNQISLNIGNHPVSLLLSEGSRAEMIGVAPPCLIAVEPRDGWQPLKPLSYRDLVVTLAKALELEHGLPTIGPETVIKGEDFVRIMAVPVDESDAGESEDPFWLSSSNSILTASAQFSVHEKGLYSLEARYLSPNPVRWSVDGCLKAITCPRKVEKGLLRTNIVSLDLEAGEYEISVTLPPGASVDKVVIRQQDGSIEEVLGIVADEGFRVDSPDSPVRRRQAIAAARRLRSLFRSWKDTRCVDSLLAMEQLGALLQASGSEAGQSYSGAGRSDNLMPDIIVGENMSSGAQGPLFPTNPGGGEPPPASPITPE